MTRTTWEALFAAFVAMGALIAANGFPATADVDLGEERVASASDVAADGMVEGIDTRIASEVSARVVEVLVDEGDDVRSGDVLVTLDTSVLDTQLAEAQAALESAQANMAGALVPVRQEEIEIARASVARAEANVRGAEQSWRNTVAVRDNPRELIARVNQARGQVELAEKAIATTQAHLAAAEAERDRTEFAASDQEKTRHQAALSQVDAARAAVLGAAAARDGAVQQLNDLLQMRDDPADLDASVDNAEAQIEVARQSLAVAQADLAVLEAGPQPEEASISRAQVEAAEAALAEVEVQRNKMTLASPGSGVVLDRLVEPGETALAGRALLIVQDVESVTVRVYIGEASIGLVRAGHPADVYVDAFPGRPFPGRVTYISDQAEFTPKSVQTQRERVNTVFLVKVRVPNAERYLKSGMPADVVIHAADKPAPALPVRTEPTSTPSVPARLPLPAAPSEVPSVKVERISTPAATAPAPSTPTAASTRLPRPPAMAAATPTAVPPAPQPGGRILFSTRDGDGAFRLWLAQAGGGEHRLIANDLHQADVRADGLVVANGEGHDNRESLFVLALDGSNLTEVSANANDTFPRWSPDGNRLLFTNEHMQEIVLQMAPRRDALRNAVGYDIVRLYGRRPAWIDDVHFVYQGCDVWRGGSVCGLYIASVDGGEKPRRIVDDTAATAPAVHSTRIAYVSRTESNLDLFLLNSGGEVQRLTASPSSELNPAWSPDGKWLAYLSDRSGAWAVWILNPDQPDRARRLFDLPGSASTDWTLETITWIP